jgi:DNA-binding transcriptional regulator YdaS (Cro superfamily)
MNAGLRDAVRAMGSIAALARELGITRGAVSQWHRVPLSRIVAIEKITGVPRQKLRPDLFKGLITTASTARENMQPLDLENDPNASARN